MWAGAEDSRMFRRTRFAVMRGRCRFFCGRWMAFGDGLPFALCFIPNFNFVVLDVLAIVKPFHGDGAA